MCACPLSEHLRIFYFFLPPVGHGCLKNGYLEEAENLLKRSYRRPFDSGMIIIPLTVYMPFIARPMLPKASGSLAEPRLSMLNLPSVRWSTLPCRLARFRPNSREDRLRSIAGASLLVRSSGPSFSAAAKLCPASDGLGGRLHSFSPGKLLDCCPASRSSPLHCCDCQIPFL